MNSHTMKAIAAERIADLHRGAVPRPEATAKGKRTRRRKRSAKRLETAPAVETRPR